MASDIGVRRDVGAIRTDLFVDGQWASTEETLDVEDLTDGGVFERVAAASPGQATAAVGAADRAQSRLSETSVPERCEWLAAIAEGIRDREADLAATIVREAGKPIASARSEVESAAERFDRAVEEARALTGEYREGTTDGHEGWRAVVKPEPIGTVLCIAPYNYPLATTALQVAPALAAGNGVVCKPASNTPVSAAILADIVDEVGLPPGAFNYVPGRGSVIGDALAGDERVDAIAMTGSTTAGKRVAERSGIVELHMELGGNAPAVVFPDADAAAVADAVTPGTLKYAGQRCSAVSRVLAHESVHDDLVERIDRQMAEWATGDLFDPETDLGPLIDEGQAQWVAKLVDDALDRGATLVRGGERDGRWFEPTLLADVPSEADIVHEEQFGPVCPVTTFADRAEALEIANAGDLALDGAVFTADHDRAMDVAERLDAGAVRINGAPSHGLGDVPFGGNGDSGIGREGLHTSIEAYLTTKSIVL